MCTFLSSKCHSAKFCWTNCFCISKNRNNSQSFLFCFVFCNFFFWANKFSNWMRWNPPTMANWGWRPLFNWQMINFKKFQNDNFPIRQEKQMSRKKFENFIKMFHFKHFNNLYKMRFCIIGGIVFTQLILQYTIKVAGDKGLSETKLKQSPCSKCKYQPVMLRGNACSTCMHKPVRCLHGLWHHRSMHALTAWDLKFQVCLGYTFISSYFDTQCGCLWQQQF